VEGSPGVVEAQPPGDSKKRPCVPGGSGSLQSWRAEKEES
jgi:hypothetical protein